MEMVRKLDDTTTGEIYVETDSTDKSLLERLDVLQPMAAFIIQRNATVNYFSGNVSYEIMDTRKNALFKANKPKAIFTSKKPCKISVKNLRNVKVLSVIVEPTCNFESTGTEASVYLYPSKKKIAHVEKYGGAVGPPCFEIFNLDRKTAFTIDNKTKKVTQSLTVEYDVSTKKGTVANIMMKTGLNFILSTDPRMPSIEKATLIGVILAMDLLKAGTRDTQEPTSNQYFLS